MRWISILTAMAVIAMVIAPAGLPLARGEDQVIHPNRYATLDVEYSLTRPTITDPLPWPPEYVRTNVKVLLYEDWMPRTTDNFIQLAEMGFYDDTIFHRVIDDFVVQGGDPDANDPMNDGSGNPILFEHHPQATHIDGAIGMARGVSPDSAESQFYLCDGEQHQLDHAERQNRTPPESGYAVFGVVVEGLHHVKKMASVWTDTDANYTEEPLPEDGRGLHDRPVYDVILHTILISPKETIVVSDYENDFFEGSTELGMGLMVLLAVPVVLIILGKKGFFKKVKRTPETVEEVAPIDEPPPEG